MALFVQGKYASQRLCLRVISKPRFGGLLPALVGSRGSRRAVMVLAETWLTLMPLAPSLALLRRSCIPPMHPIQNHANHAHSERV
jgi:hypothetical protein